LSVVVQGETGLNGGDGDGFLKDEGVGELLLLLVLVLLLVPLRLLLLLLLLL